MININTFINKDELIKGKKAAVGEIREHGGKSYKKIDNGKWQQVSKHNLTQKEHKDIAESYIKNDAGKNKSFNLRQIDKHGSYANSISDKEYDDSHFDENKDDLESLKKQLKDLSKNNSHLTNTEYDEQTANLGRKIEKLEGRDNIKKSHITNELGNSNNINISKKGSEIKEKLIVLFNDETLECNMYFSELISLKDKINSEPSKQFDDEWTTKGIIGLNKPNRYDYAECWDDNDNKDSITSLKREYNELVYKFIQSQVELKQLTTMIKNLIDTKVYDLSITQATLLGF